MVDNLPQVRSSPTMLTQSNSTHRDDPEDPEISSSDAAMERKLTVEEALEVAPPPDGGFQAWLHVGLLHIVFFNTWGVANSFGVFQQYYAAELLSSESPSSLSWIGSVQTACLFAFGVASGRAADAGYFRSLLYTGVFFQVFGIMMASLGKTYWQIFLAQGLCVGLGNGLAFIPSLSVASTYFQRRRAAAIGLGASGAAFGGLIYPILVRQLINPQRLGFGWTMRVMGFMMLAIYTPCLIWMRSRLPPRKAGPLIDRTAFKEAPFMLFTLSFFFNFWGTYTAFFYISTFVRDMLGFSATDAGNLVAVLNGVGVIGRLAPGIIAQRWTGLLNLLTPLAFIASLIVYLWSQVYTSAGLYAFVVVNGLLAHASQSLYPTISTTMTPDLNKTGTRTGMTSSFVSLAVLTGPAISGALIERGVMEGKGYLYAQMFAGTSIALSAFFCLGARVAKGGWGLKVKV